MFKFAKLLVVVIALVFYCFERSTCYRVTAPSEDFYQLLGVPRTADDTQIRRAFKKLALQYHPDKNKDNPQQAQEQFQKITNAYDVLIDPQLRDIYNKEGARGLNEYFQAQAQKQGEKTKEKKKEKETQLRDAFLKNTEIIELKENLDKLKKRDIPWVILLYASNDIVCTQMAPAFIQFAEQVGQFIQVGVIDCKQEINQEICQKEFEVFEYPVIFGIRTDSSKEHLRFEREVTAKNLKNFAIGLMDSYVLYITEENYKEFIEIKPNLPKLLLFRSRPVTPPIAKALSKKFLDKLVIGEVDVHLEETLAEKFGIESSDLKNPILILLTEPLDYKGNKYEGIWNFEQIVQFLRPYNYPFELTKKDIFKSHCDVHDKQLCFLMIADKKGIEGNLELLNKLRKDYENDNGIKFFYMNREQVSKECLFKEEGQKDIEIVVIRPNKMKFERFESEVNEQNLNEFIEQILGGKKMVNDMKTPLAKCMK